MFKRLLLSSALLLNCAGFAVAANPSYGSGPLSQKNVTPTMSQGGNTKYDISVRASTGAVVIVSSAPENRGVGVYNYHYRLVINCSDGPLQLVDRLGYTSFSSTYGVVLSSGTSGVGDAQEILHQGVVYGIWGSSTTLNGGGACGEEQVFK